MHTTIQRNTRPMGSAARTTAAWIAALGILATTASAWAQQGPAMERRAAWYEGSRVTALLTPNDPAVSQIPNDLPAHIAQPIYRVIKPGPLLAQEPVIGVIPGDIGYTGWWQMRILLDLSGRDLAADPYTSVGELAANTCRLPGFPSNIPACRAQGTELFDVTGAGGLDNLLVNIPILIAEPPLPFCPD